MKKVSIMLKKKKTEMESELVQEVTPWHSFETQEVFKQLDTNEKGLSNNEVVTRLEKFGPNMITISERFKILKMIVGQFTNFLVMLLIVAGTISLVLGLIGAGEAGTSEIIDAIAIFTIVVINAIIGFVQDYRSNQALEKLKEYFEQDVIVVREGKEKVVHSSDLVPGDIIRLEVGEKIPADCRLLEANSFKVDEAALTGESSSVTKNLDIVPVEARIHDRKNMIYSGTTCVYGRGEAVVANTGMRTEMGRIAELTQVKEELTPLQEALDKLGKVLGIIILILCALVMGIDWLWLGESFLESFETAVALAISAVPEGLPAAIVITLAIGVSKMAKKNTIVSKLPAVETLGSVDYICSDKTGTLTRNEMTVKEIWTIDGLYEVEGSGYLLDGDFIKDGKKVNPMEIPTLKTVLQTSYHCNNSAVIREGDRISIKGDPTEAAMLVAAEKGGFSEEMLLKMEHEIFFDSDRKRMTTIHDEKGKKYAFMKGSPPVVLTRCNSAMKKGKESMMTKAIEQEIIKSNLALAEKALRVLAVAYRELPKNYDKTKNDEIEDDMIFLGLAGMIDPPRPEVKDAIEECRMAGITTVMITGDQEATAVAIAKEVGLIESDKHLVVSGEKFSLMTNEELIEKIENIRVYSRMSPKDKYRVVEILQEKDHVVAVTGDGVNDAPALKKADIGVAMGITGTDVSKEVAAMVITDDAFNTIVAAVEEGRNIFENMKKFIRYLLSCNFDEIFAVLIIYAAFQELPFLPLQILFLNLLTDALPALSLSFDPYDPELMKRPPRGKKSSFVMDMYAFASFAGVIALIGSLGIFLVGYLGIGDRVITNWAHSNNQYLGAEQFHEAKVAYSQTLAFVATLSFELWFVFIARNDNATSFLKSKPFKNKYLIGAVVLSWILLLGVVYIPLFQATFTGFKEVLPYYLISLEDWAYIIGFTLGLCILFEIFRYALRTERMAGFAKMVGMH